MTNLSERERDVVALVAEGDEDKLIAVKLGIAADTVRKHTMAARKKTGCRNRTLLAIKWIRGEIT